MVTGEKLCSRCSVGVVRRSCASAQRAHTQSLVSFSTPTNFNGVVASAFSPRKISTKIINTANTTRNPISNCIQCETAPLSGKEYQGSSHFEYSGYGELYAGRGHRLLNWREKQ